MKSDYRVVVFCLVLLIAAPALYALGESLGGTALAVLLPSVAVIASFAFARWRRRPPSRAPGDSAAVAASRR